MHVCVCVCVCVCVEVYKADGVAPRGGVGVAHYRRKRRKIYSCVGVNTHMRTHYMHTYTYIYEAWLRYIFTCFVVSGVLLALYCFHR